MKSISTIIANIRAEANNSIYEALVTRVGAINSAFDDAYGSCLGGHYSSGMECLAMALKWIEELVDMAKSTTVTTEQPMREYLRDSVPSINLDKAPLDEGIKNAIRKEFKDALNVELVRTNPTLEEIEELLAF